jgi:hypothetical protein
MQPNYSFSLSLMRLNKENFFNILIFNIITLFKYKENN